MDDGSENRDLESTATLLRLVRAGDLDARERLFAAYLPILSRWAHGRLPSQARDLAETSDLVQVTLMAAFKRIGEFTPHGEGAFLAYLRRILLNEIKDEVKRKSRHPTGETLNEAVPNQVPSTVERVVGNDALQRFDQALERLSEQQRQAVILRLEFGFTFKEIASAMEFPSTDAARMAVSRALVRLAEVMA